MAKLKNIIRQLSDNDYKAIYDSLNESNAEKSAYLLKSMREKSLSDNKIMEELEVNTNAYYTLRSRLNQKIEEYLLQQMENPRTDILKKVANITEIIFTKKKAIAIATLKKLEKELLDYDLSNELTVVYKSLKKMHINSPEQFTYSQQYNKHVAYMLAVDKAEDLLSEYFRKFGDYTMTGSDLGKLELSLLSKEMNNVSNLYQSHRLYVYQSCINIFHRLYVEKEETLKDVNLEPIEDILDKVESIFANYYLDSIYFHLKLVFDYLKLEYYTHYKVYRKAEKYFDEINESVPMLLSNYSLFTYPAQVLITKLERHMRMDTEKELYEENEGLFGEFEPDKNDIPKYVTYTVYRALCCYYVKKYDEASKWINNLLNDVSLKKFQEAQLEIKVLLAIQYCLLDDYELFNQLINSIQRQVRLLGKENCEHIILITKILKVSIGDQKKTKAAKIRTMVQKLAAFERNHFQPTLLIKADEDFVSRLA